MKAKSATATVTRILKHGFWLKRDGKEGYICPERAKQLGLHEVGQKIRATLVDDFGVGVFQLSPPPHDSGRYIWNDVNGSYLFGGYKGSIDPSLWEMLPVSWKRMKSVNLRLKVI